MFSLAIVVVCGAPKTPQDGSVFVTGHHYLSVATFECNEGYELVGNASALCTEAGTWSTPAPICIPPGKTSCVADASRSVIIVLLLLNDLKYILTFYLFHLLIVLNS